jgi:integrase
VDVRGKESFHRRALNDDEARRLLAGQRKSLYLLALHTGLRRGEINALRWGDLHLDVANPFYAVPVAKSKSRKEQPRPLHPELVRELQAMKSAEKATGNLGISRTGSGDESDPRGFQDRRHFAGGRTRASGGLPCAANDLHHAPATGGCFTA